MIKVVTLALESSGRQWLDSILRKHPDVSIIAADSVPSGWYDLRHYPEIPDGADFLIVSVRDVHCQRASVKDRNYNDGQGGKFSDAESIEWMNRNIDRYGDRVVFFDYEAALLYRQRYLDHLFRLIGARPIVLDVEYLDGNKKYYAR